MKLLALILLLVPLATCELFNFKKGFASKYQVTFSAEANGQKYRHEGNILIKKNQKGQLVGEIQDVDVDQKLAEQREVLDEFHKIFEKTYIFEFNEFGQIIYLNQDQKPPTQLIFDRDLIKRIRDGERKISKMIVVPQMEKLCTADFEVLEKSDHFAVAATVESECMGKPSTIKSQISFSLTLFKETFTLRSYILTIVLELIETGTKEKGKEIITSTSTWRAKFLDFVDEDEKHDEL